MKLNCIFFPQPPKKPEPPKPEEPKKPEPPKPEEPKKPEPPPEEPKKPEPPKPEEPKKPEPPKPEEPKKPEPPPEEPKKPEPSKPEEPKIPEPPKEDLPKEPPPEEPPQMDITQTLDTVNNTNLKLIAEAGAWAQAQKEMNDVSHDKRMNSYIENTMQNQIKHQQTNYIMSEARLGAFLEKMASLDPIKVVSDAKILSIPTDTLKTLAISEILKKIAEG